MGVKQSANRKRGPGKPFSKDDPRINRKGRPPKGNSWAENLRLIQSADGPTIAAWADHLREFKRLPEGVSLQTLVCANAFASLLRDFSPGVWNLIMERTDGKTPLPVMDVLPPAKFVEEANRVILRYYQEGRVTWQQISGEYGAENARRLFLENGIPIPVEGEEP